MLLANVEAVGVVGSDLESLEEPNLVGDLVLRLVIILVMVGGLILVSTQALGSVGDTSGPATAPTTAAPVATTRAETTTTPTSARPTVGAEAVLTLAPITVPPITLSEAEIAAIESEEAEESVPTLQPLGAASSETTDVSTPETTNSSE
ncbi:MAG: hypothetical protein ACI8TP_000614 [Acidimicrobiales bacterium]